LEAGALKQARHGELAARLDHKHEALQVLALARPSLRRDFDLLDGDDGRHDDGRPRVVLVVQHVGKSHPGLDQLQPRSSNAGVLCGFNLDCALTPERAREIAADFAMISRFAARRASPAISSTRGAKATESSARSRARDKD